MQSWAGRLKVRSEIVLQVGEDATAELQGKVRVLRHIVVARTAALVVRRRVIVQHGGQLLQWHAIRELRVERPLRRVWKLRADEAADPDAPVILRPVGVCQPVLVLQLRRIVTLQTRQRLTERHCHCVACLSWSDLAVQCRDEISNVIHHAGVDPCVDPKTGVDWRSDHLHDRPLCQRHEIVPDVGLQTRRQSVAGEQQQH